METKQPEKLMHVWVGIGLDKANEHMVIASIGDDEETVKRETEESTGLPSLALDVWDAKTAKVQIEIFLAEHDIVGVEATQVRQMIGLGLRDMLKKLREERQREAESECDPG